MMRSVKHPCNVCGKNCVRKVRNGVESCAGCDAALLIKKKGK